VNPQGELSGKWFLGTFCRHAQQQELRRTAVGWPEGWSTWMCDIKQKVPPTEGEDKKEHLI